MIFPMNFMVRALFDLFFLIALFGSVPLAITLFWLKNKIGAMDSKLRSSLRNNRAIRLDDFSIEVGVHGSFANWYLTRKARQLNGLHYKDDWGDTIYFFGESKQKMFQQIMESDRSE